MNTIVISDQDAELFKKFMLYHDLFHIMEQSGVFDVNYGKVTLNIAANLVQTVVVEEIKYKR